VKQHDNAEDCWIILYEKVYDVTSFLEEHPGGSAAASDCKIRRKKRNQRIRRGSCAINHRKRAINRTIHGHDRPQHNTRRPRARSIANRSIGCKLKAPLESLIAVHDFEEVARRFFTAKAFAFYSSAASDLVSHHFNLSCHRKLMLRPRVLRNVKEVSLKRRILGCETSTPFFVSPAAMAKLAHPDGELAIARACANQGIIQSISSNASYALPEIVAAGMTGQPFFFQLYVNSDRSKTEALLRTAKTVGVKALLVTVDAPVPGKREVDERIAAGNLVSAVSGAVATNDKKGGGLGRVMAKYIDPTLVWEDIDWLRQTSGLPIVLKGIQTASDARKAVQHGVDGILLSNHGGRSLDTTQPAMLTLLELHKQAPEVFDSLEVLVDGGFTRGTDILKAVALGASGIGIARPFLYSLAYGQEGTEHLIEVLKDELEVALKQVGITDVNHAHPGLVNTSLLEGMIRGEEEHTWIKWMPKARL
ncbi:unnamed protein product, partial [Aureobasidium vineae]